jgi:glycosyltransferase involved in cell wall biosynthesis
MGYFANQEAMRWYLEKIHPQIITNYPHLTVQIIGMGPPDWLITLARNSLGSVEVVGEVRDMRKYLAQAQIAICPLLHGSGTRLKLLEYMAHGLPIVSTRKGAEGLPVVDGKDILLADSSDEFIKAIQLICEQSTLQKSLSHHGQVFVQKYAWPVLGEKLINVYRELEL